MSPKQEKEPINLVEIDSSDDEDDVGVQVQTVAVNPPSASGNQTLESRSFWKAGDFNIGPTKFTPAQGCCWFHKIHTCMHRHPPPICIYVCIPAEMLLTRKLL